MHDSTPHIDDELPIVGKSVGVLDKGYVSLIDFMPHPKTGIDGDMAIVNAARVSFLGDSKGEEADKKLLFYMLRNGHTSPFEQVVFKFRVKAPLVTWWQWVRHRTWSFNSQSGRYTPFQEDDFYVPDVWRAQSTSNKQASEGVIGEQMAMNHNLEDFYKQSFALYKEALDFGVSKELARLFLPGFSVYYTWICSVDAHNLMHFLKLRMDDHAQHEIRVYAETIYTHFFKPLLPWTAQAFEQYSLKRES